MVRFQCPRCDAALKVPDDRAGQKTTCPECQRSVLVPKSRDDEVPAAELDTRGWRKFPPWARWVAALALVTIVVGIIVTAVRSGPKDGLTRAERAELEAKLKRDLPGTWVQSGPEDGLHVHGRRAVRSRPV